MNPIFLLHFLFTYNIILDNRN